MNFQGESVKVVVVMGELGGDLSRCDDTVFFFFKEVGRVGAKKFVFCFLFFFFFFFFFQSFPLIFFG